MSVQRLSAQLASAQLSVPLPVLHVKPFPDPSEGIIEFEEFSMWNEETASFCHPERQYRDSLTKWLEERYDTFSVSIREAYIYIRALAIPDLAVRPFKIAGRVVVWLSPDENPSITYAGCLQRRARRMPDSEHYEALIPHYLPDHRFLEEIVLEYFKIAIAVTYLGDHLVVELPKPGNGRIPIPASYHKMKFRIPVSFTYGPPLFERRIIQSGRAQAGAFATNAQSALVRIAELSERHGKPSSSRIRYSGELQYNKDALAPSFPPGYQNLICQGRRVVRRDPHEPASETSQFWWYDVFATNQIFPRGRLRRFFSNDALQRLSIDSTASHAYSSLSASSTRSPVSSLWAAQSSRPYLPMYFEGPTSPSSRGGNFSGIGSGSGSSSDDLPAVETPFGGNLSAVAYEQSLMRRRHIDFVRPAFYNDSTSAYDTSVITP